MCSHEHQHQHTPEEFLRDPVLAAAAADSAVDEIFEYMTMESDQIVCFVCFVLFCLFV